MMISHLKTAHETTLRAPLMYGLGEIRLLHPPGTFAPTPASLISLQAIARNQNLLMGNGLDWGSGIGCLAIAAAKVVTVQKVVGLEISEANIVIARENALRNGVEHKTAFLLSDSYLPMSHADCLTLDSLTGRTNFILANPPASERDDGFGYRRIVLKGARKYLTTGGVVFLSVSSQYGHRRVERLCEEIPGFTYCGILSSTEWVPFDLTRPDLLQCLRLYAAEETRGGLVYSFLNSDAKREESMNARSALAQFKITGQSPWMKWQTHLFEFRPA